MPKRLISLAIMLIGVGLIITLSRDILRLLKSADRIKQAQRETEELEKRNQELKSLKEYYQSEEFIEQQARDKLNLSKEGEAVVILPPNVEGLVGGKEEKVPLAIPNWQKWWQLFF